MTTVSFTTNWMIENQVCDSTRAQILYLDQFSGQLSITGLTVTNHLGAPANSYLTTGTGSNLNIALLAGLTSS